MDASTEELIVDQMIKTLREDDISVNRVKAASLLGAWKSDRGVIPLCEALQDPSSDVRAEAASSLGKISSKEAIGYLLIVLKDQDPEVSRKAALALGAIYSKDIFTSSEEVNIREVVIQLHKILENQILMANDVVTALGNISDSYSIPNLAKYQDQIEITRNIVIAEINNIKRRSKHNESQPIIDAIKDLDKKMPDPNTPKVQMTFTNSTIHSATGNVEGNLYVNAPTKTPAEAAKEIQDLLAQLDLNAPATNGAEQLTLVNRILQAIQKFPNLRDMFVAGTIEAIKIICPPLGIPIEMGKKLLEAAEKEKES
jgi:hypothetical protein